MSPVLELAASLSRVERWCKNSAHILSGLMRELSLAQAGIGARTVFEVQRDIGRIKQEIRDVENVIKHFR